MRNAKDYTVGLPHECHMTWHPDPGFWQVYQEGDSVYQIPVTGEELATKIHESVFPTLRKAWENGRRQGAEEEKMKMRRAAQILFSPITTELSNLGAMLEQSLRHMPRGGQ